MFPYRWHAQFSLIFLRSAKARETFISIACVGNFRSLVRCESSDAIHSNILLYCHNRMSARFNAMNTNVHSANDMIPIAKPKTQAHLYLVRSLCFVTNKCAPVFITSSIFIYMKIVYTLLLAVWCRHTYRISSSFPLHKYAHTHYNVILKLLSLLSINFMNANHLICFVWDLARIDRCTAANDMNINAKLHLN